MRRALAWGLILAIGTLLGVAIGGIPDRGKDAPLEVSAGATTTTPSTSPIVPATTTTPLRPPADVKVIAVNASGANGRAAAVNKTLAEAGYAVVQPGVNARSEPDSSVYWTDGYQAEALALAVSLELPAGAARPLPDPPPAIDLRGAVVMVVLGRDRAR